MKSSLIFAKYLLIILISIQAFSFQACCLGGDTYDYSSLSFDDFVDLFAQAFVDNDTSNASYLKSLYPGYYNRMLDNLYYNSQNKDKTKSERNAASLFYAWAVLIK